jgi:hypothetical protein
LPVLNELAMSDDLTKKDFHDKTRVSGSEPHELKYWSQKWNVSEQELKEAIRAVGPAVKDLEKYFREPR